MKMSMRYMKSSMNINFPRSAQLFKSFYTSRSYTNQFSLLENSCTHTDAYGIWTKPVHNYVVYNDKFTYYDNFHGPCIRNTNRTCL